VLPTVPTPSIMPPSCRPCSSATICIENKNENVNKTNRRDAKTTEKITVIERYKSNFFDVRDRTAFEAEVIE
jgi:hypothetical protein